MLLLLLFIPSLASANSPPPAPQPDYVLNLEYPPEETYCIAILTQDSENALPAEALRLAYPDSGPMIDALFSLTDEGWYPLREEPDGGIVQRAGISRIVWMDLAQRPTEYRLLFATQSGLVQVTDTVVRRHYSNYNVYEVAANRVIQNINYRDYAIRVIIAVVITLAVELGLLVAFGFSFKQNWRLVVATNLITQLALNIILFATEYFEWGPDESVLLVWLELVIPVIEAVVYARLIRERTTLRRIVYAFVANYASLVTGMMLYAMIRGDVYLFYMTIFYPVIAITIIFS